MKWTPNLGSLSIRFSPPGRSQFCIFIRTERKTYFLKTGLVWAKLLFLLWMCEVHTLQGQVYSGLNFSYESPIEFHCIHIILQCPLAWVLILIPFSRPKNSRQRGTYCRCNENKVSMSFLFPLERISKIGFLEYFKKPLSKWPSWTPLWVSRFYCSPLNLKDLGHNSCQVMTSSETRREEESFSPSIWRSSVRIRVILALELRWLIWGQKRKYLMITQDDQ